MSFCSFLLHFKKTIPRVTAVAGIFFLLVSFFVYTTHTYAETAEELQTNLNSLSDKIKALDKEIAEFNTKIGQTQGEAKTLKAALASLELRRAVLVKEIDRTKLRITETQKNIQETEGELEVTQARLSKDKQGLSEALRSLVYQDTNMSPFFSILTSDTARLSDVFDTIKRGEDISRAIKEKVSHLHTTQVQLSTQKDLFEQNKKTLESLADQLSDQQTLVLQTAKDKSSLLTKTNNKEVEYQKLLAERKKKKGELEVEMLDIESKIKIAVDVSKLPTTGKGVLLYPLDKVVITQYFGNTDFSTKNPQVYNGSGHNGVDFGVKVGTPILAAQSGKVLGTGDTDASCSGVSYGKWVLIRHGNGLTTLYAHLSVIQVEAGQTVTAREKIGLSGNTGYSTGPHLHFTVYASDSVHISGPTEYKSKVCGTYLIMPLAPRAGYLNPLSYF